MGVDTFRDQVIHEFPGTLLIFGDTFMVSRGDSRKFVAWLSDDKRVLGMEGMDFDGTSVIPSSECIADFSTLDKTKNGHDEALEALSSEPFSRPHFIEFVIE